MADKSAIEWTDATWNPLRGTAGKWTCSKISPGCDNCYASSMNRRFSGLEYPRVGEERNDQVRLDEQVLTQPSRWKRPRVVFVCSMTDLFEESVPFEWIDRVFFEMLQNPRHTFQVLTKRPGRLVQWWKERFRPENGTTLLPANIWLGTTVDEDRYSWRAKKLVQVPAAVHFVSAQPLLSGLPSLDLTDIEWVIVGGESGHGARPMHPDWARSLRDQCQEAGVAYFFKQWGEYIPSPAIYPAKREEAGRLVQMTISSSTDRRQVGGVTHYAMPSEISSRMTEVDLMDRVGKHKAGRLLDGRTWDEMPVVREGTRV